MEKRGIRILLTEAFHTSRQMMRAHITIIFLFSILMIIAYFTATIRRDFIDYLTNFFTYKTDLSYFTFLAIALIALTIVSYILNFIGEYQLQMCGIKAFKAMSQNILEKIYVAKPTLEYITRGDVITRFLSDLPTLSDMLGGLIPALSVNAIRLSGGFIIIWLLCPSLALFSLLIIPLYYMIYKFTSNKVIEYSSSERSSLSDATDKLKESIDAHAFVRRTLSEEYFHKRVYLSLRLWFTNIKKLIFFRVFFSQTFNGVYNFLTVILFLIGGYLVISGNTTVGTLVAFVGAAFNIYEPVVNLSNFASQWLSMVPYLSRYYDLLHLETENIEEGKTLSAIEEIELNDVSLAIDKQTILKNINMHIKKGETIALVGPSGSGKTSLALLLLRFHRLSSGTIRINTRKYEEYKIKDLRSLINYVPDEDFIFKGPLIENITLGKNLDKNVILNAVKIARLDFIKDLNEVIEPEKLSMGQRQRIALARALANQPMVLILDEALSGVDALTESAILSDIKKCFGYAMLIIITHRLSALKHTDRVYFLVDGKIAACGLHNELYLKCKLYRKIVKEYSSLK